jgi:hypothetical protein
LPHVPGLRIVHGHWSFIQPELKEAISETARDVVPITDS